MGVFSVLFAKLIPLYVLIGLGFVASRWLKVKRETIASLLIYIIAPCVILTAVSSTPLTPRLLCVPLLFFVVCSTICLLSLQLGRRLWRGPTANIFAFSVGTGNTGYFGFPVAIFLFGEKSLGLAVLVGFGFLLFENTTGFFVTARGTHTTSEAIRKVLRLPTVYAFALGVALSLSGVRPAQALLDVGTNFRGAYTVLGMMLIGVGLGDMARFRLDLRFISFSFLIKFLFWPLVIYGLIAADAHTLQWIEPSMRQVMMLMATVPLPANSVALAAHLGTEPEKAATAVLASTLFALIYIPWMSTWIF